MSASPDVPPDPPGPPGPAGPADPPTVPRRSLVAVAALVERTPAHVRYLIRSGQVSADRVLGRYEFTDDQVAELQATIQAPPWWAAQGLHTLADVASLVDRHPEWLRHLARAGRIESTKIGGRYAFTDDQVNALRRTLTRSDQRAS